MYEYKVIAAPTRGVKAKGVRSAEARFSNALEQTMNELAAAGWEYQRAETLPSTERSGLASTTTTWRNVLVFRRPMPFPDDAVTEEPALALAAPQREDIALEDIPPVLRDESMEEEIPEETPQESIDVEQKMRDQAWKDERP
ncbi:MAG: DUF4177 domain-containing protein [Roseobacter sp.]